MHRKFIALILAAALAVTGLSAAPARADGDTARLLAGLAFLGLIGMAIEDSRKHTTIIHNNTLPPRPLPPRINRLDLPQHCLRTRNVNGRSRDLFGAGCLRRNYAFSATLPQACRLGFWNGNRSRTGYEPRCLREHGYRFARR